MTINLHDLTGQESGIILVETDDGRHMNMVATTSLRKLEDHCLLISRKRSNNAKPICKRMVRHLLVLQEHRRCQ